MAEVLINTGNTLSIFSSPGQDKRFPITSSDSVFTFGDFRIERPNIFDNLELSSSAVSFSNFSTLDNFSGDTSTEIQPFGTSENELNPDVTNPQSYAYFGSFYTKVSRAINTLIETFPYAILSYTSGSSNTVFGYTTDTVAGTSTFKLALSGISNQGNVIFASGVTETDTKTLYNNYNTYGIQFSGTANTHTYNIIGYQYTTGTTGYMQFTVEGYIFTGSTSATTEPIYVRPTVNDYSQYQRTISNLEYQLAFDGTFKIPDIDNETLSTYETFTWPRSIDGFNLDTYGDDYDDYVESILLAATRVDDVKTSWMTRTMIPEQFTELDTDTQIYQKLISTYAEEFDSIKGYIDNLAFMHTVDYDRIESVPDKFMYKLSRLLAFDFHDAFTDTEIFDYFLTEDEDGKTLQDYNFELWRKMLVNIVWLYKKKGTRDAIMFLFKLIGAPECLVNLNEFVYEIVKTASAQNAEAIDPASAEQDTLSNKIDTDGYINFDASKYIFQEGGIHRGNGQSYLDQWSPEFTLKKIVDNVKVYTGDTEFGTRNLVNSKEVDLSLNPASAIECDVKDWYTLGFGLWSWGTTGLTASPFTVLAFSGMTVPFEWTPDPYSILNILPNSITAMTISQWIDFLYASNVDPTNRKTVSNYSNHMGQYMSLKKIYMTYMLWTNNQESNRLTFGKMERLLELLERNFFGYMEDFVPATTILENISTVYRNTVFERQKFIYPTGLNDGSEFQKELPPELEKTLEVAIVQSTVNNNIQPQSLIFSIENSVVNNIIAQNPANTVVATTAAPINPSNFSFTVVSNFYPETDQDFTTANMYTTQISNYFSGNTVVAFYGENSIFNTGLTIGSIAIDNIS